MIIPLQKNIEKDQSRKEERKYKKILLSGDYLPDDNTEFCIAPYIEGVMPYDDGFLHRVGCFAKEPLAEAQQQIPPQAIAVWKAEKAEKEASIAEIPTTIREALKTLYDFYADIDEWRDEDNCVHGLNTYDDLIRDAVLPCPISDATLEDESTDDEDRHDEDQIIFHVYRRYDDSHIELLKTHLATIERYASENPNFNEYTVGTTLRGIAFLSDLLAFCTDQKNK